MTKSILFIDGDNINESYTQRIFEEAKKYGEVYEAHCFADFVKRKQRWEIAYSQYRMQLHYILGSEKQKGKPDPNTSDIALAVFAMQKLYELPDLDTYIIAANDKDYIPLAKAIREKFHKKVVMFYTEQNDKAVSSYDEAVLLQEKESVQSSSSAVTADDNLDIYSWSKYCVLIGCIEEQLKSGDKVLLSKFGPILKEKGINYTSTLQGYLKEMFRLFPELDKHYVLKLSDKRDRIERVA